MQYLFIKSLFSLYTFYLTTCIYFSLAISMATDNADFLNVYENVGGDERRSNQRLCVLGTLC